MSKYKKLMSNSIVFAVGNFGSKFINILMVPLYTFYLTTENYGTVDLVTTLVSLLLPIFSFCIYEGVLRFSMERESDIEEVWTNSLFIQIILSFFCILLLPVLSMTLLNDYKIVIVGLLLLQLFQILLSQFVRGIGNVIYYSINGILMTLIIATSNIFFIVKLGMGVNGYIYSIILANVISVFFLFFSSKVYKFINFNKFSLSFIKESLYFSMPLVPNTLMWWLINSSSRLFIVYFLGASANGLFAVSNKVPMILTSIIAIFNQAWQMSAIEEYDSKDRSIFYNKVYSSTISVLYLSTSLILIILLPLFQYAIGSEFYNSWKYVPFLLLGVVYSSFATFLGTNYVAAKKTKGLVITSLYCGVINIILNTLLIPIIGINGASISSMISLFVLWMLRIEDTKKFVDIGFDKQIMIFNNGMIFLQILFLYYFDGVWNISIQILSFIIMLIINKEFILKFKNIILEIRR